MKKLGLAVVILGVSMACNNSSDTAVLADASAQQSTAESNSDLKTMAFHEFSSKTLMGDNFDFSSLSGKRVLVVNTASECGFTPQYKQLQELYKQYGGDKFTIVGFPSNDFGSQEPGSNDEIAAFCEKNYGVSFPMMDKVRVKKGEGQHPVYTWLTQKDQNGVSDAKVRWNFNKFLIDENGKWVAYYPSRVNPLDDEIVNFAKGN